MTIDLSELSTDPDGDSLTYELVGQFGQIIEQNCFSMQVKCKLECTR